MLCQSVGYLNSTLPFGPNITQYSVTKLPNVTYNVPQSWAGQIDIPGTQDSSLFFWLFETEVTASSDNLIIWLDGGPGCSSLAGLTGENGPLAFYGNATVPAPNPYSWTKLANVLYVDQPVGTGFSTGSVEATDNDQVTQMFYAWLTAFYAQFPRLTSMNTYLMGESYAGIFIPYFTQAILENFESLPVNLRSLSMGDPTIGNWAAMQDVPVTAYLHQQENILGISPDVLSVFDAAASTCGFNDVLAQMTYPQNGTISVPGDPEGQNYKLRKRQVDPICAVSPTTAAAVNSFISNCDGSCATWTAAIAYLSAEKPCFAMPGYDDNIDYACGQAPNIDTVAAYLDHPAVRAAIHAPDKNIVACNQTIADILTAQHVVPPAYALLPSFLEAGIQVHIWSGDYDILLPHIGTELVIQNMTWCGHTGFESPPNNTFLVNGTVAGNWGYERGLSYHHFLYAGHSVPHDRPAAAFAYVKDFIMGSAGEQSQ